MDRKFDFIGIGEVLIDMAPSLSAEGESCFLPKVGGAPANSACAAAKFGLSSAVIGRVGDDIFGNMIHHVISSAGANCSFLQTDPGRHTTLTFVSLDQHGDRSFTFYRNGMADTALEETQDMLSAASNTRLLHFGSVSLSSEPSRSSVLSAVSAAKKAGAIISYDPNLRFPLWDDYNYMRDTVLNTLGLADILKLSEEEAAFLFNSDDRMDVMKRIEAKYHIPAIIITKGKNGADALINGQEYTSPGFEINAVDTTGAGDCFIGGFCRCLISSGKSICKLQVEEAEYALRFANAAGALATSKKGAIPSIPDISEVLDLLASR